MNQSLTSEHMNDPVITPVTSDTSNKRQRFALSSKDSSSKLTIEVPIQTGPYLVSPDPGFIVLPVPPTNTSIETIFSPNQGNFISSIESENVHVHPKMKLKSKRKNDATKKTNDIPWSSSSPNISKFDKDLLTKKMDEMTQAALILKQKTDQMDRQPTQHEKINSSPLLPTPTNVRFSPAVAHPSSTPNRTFFQTPPTFVMKDYSPPTPLQLQPLRELFRGSMMENELFSQDSDGMNGNKLPSITTTNFTFGRVAPSSIFPSPTIRPQHSNIVNTSSSMVGSILSSTVHSVCPTDEMVFALDNDNDIHNQNTIDATTKPQQPLPSCGILTKSLEER